MIKSEKEKQIEQEEVNEKENDARRKRVQERQRKREEKAKAKVKTKKPKTPEEELKEIKEGDDDWTIEEIEEQFNKKRDLRKVFRTIIKSEPAMVRDIMEEMEWTKESNGSQARKMLTLLKEFKFAEKVPIIEIWAKDYAVRKLGLKTELTKKEILILNKFNFWTKSMKEDMKNKYLGVSNYWILTDLGLKNVGILNKKPIPFPERSS